MVQAEQVNIPIERKNGEVWAFMSLKFHDGDSDKKKVDSLTDVLKVAGIKNVVMARDVEKWGNAEIPRDKQLMPDFAFPAIEKCDMLICEFSEKGVGLGIGAAYAYAKRVPVYLIAKRGSDISTTMCNIANDIIFYDNLKELIEPFKKIVNKLPRVILASNSEIRKQMIINTDIPFEVVASNAIETHNTSKPFRAQLAEIAMEKAKAVLNKTSDRALRLIIAADQNIVFEGNMYGKPKSLDNARKLIKSMQGRNNIYSYTGNAVLIANGKEVLESVNITDVAKMSMDVISDEILENYLENHEPLTKCGGFNIINTPFVHLKEGKYSTACGMTIEIAQKMYKALKLYAYR